jgi:hypothetical protein
MIIQATKVWWDGERLMVETIEPASIYKDKEQDSTCNNALRLQGRAYPRTCAKCKFGPCVADRVQPGQDYEHVVYNTSGIQLEAGFYAADELRQMLKSLDHLNAIAKRRMEKNQ